MRRGQKERRGGERGGKERSRGKNSKCEERRGKKRRGVQRRTGESRFYSIFPYLSLSIHQLVMGQNCTLYNLLYSFSNTLQML